MEQKQCRLQSLRSDSHPDLPLKSFEVLTCYKHERAHQLFPRLSSLCCLQWEELLTPQPLLTLFCPAVRTGCLSVCRSSLEEALALQRVSVLIPYNSWIFCQNLAARGGNQLSDMLTPILVMGQNSRVWRKSSPTPSALPTTVPHHNFPRLIKDQCGFSNPQQKPAFRGNVINPHLTPYLV